MTKLRLIVALAGSIAVATHATPVEAQGPSAFSLELDSSFIAAGVIVGISYFAMETAIIVKTIQGAVDGAGLRPGWAILELGWGAVNMTALGLLVTVTELNSSQLDAGVVAQGIGMTALGLYHVAHGIYTLVARPYATPPASPAAAIDVAVLPGGAALSLSSTF